MGFVRWILMTVVLVPAFASALSEMDGFVHFRLENECARTTKLDVKLWVNNSNQATLYLQSEGKMKGVLEGTKVKVSLESPKRFVGYQLDLNPKLGASNGKALIELNSSGTEFCDESANSLLTAYAVDGSSTVSCVYFEMPK